MCVQKFDDSLGFAIRPTYRISLRPSSLWEPRHPSLKVVCYALGYVKQPPTEASSSFPIQVVGSGQVKVVKYI
jgi:hypothetical protein